MTQRLFATTDRTSSASLTVNGTADGVLNPAEVAAVAFTVAGLDAGDTGIVRFTDGRHTLDVKVTANGTFTTGLYGFFGNIESRLLFTDIGGNAFAVAGNTVQAMIDPPEPTVEVTRSGGEILISGDSHSSPYDHSLARLSNGNVAVTWFDQDNDPSLNSIRTKVVDAEGHTVSAEMVVSAPGGIITGVKHPQITALSDGRYAVAYHVDKLFIVAGNPGTTQTHVQIFGTDGRPEGPVQVVGGWSFRDGPNGDVTITGLSDGGYIAVIERMIIGSTPFAQYEVVNKGLWALRYDAEGRQIGSFYPGVNDPADDGHPAGTPVPNASPNVAGLTGGGFVVTWDHNGVEISLDEVAIHGQVYDAQGEPVGPVLQIGMGRPLAYYQTAVTGLANGNFVVSWSDGSSDTSHVYAQVYSATGLRIGDESIVDSIPRDGAVQPVTAALADGGFVVAWADIDSTTGGYSIHARAFDATGQASSSEFIANTTVSSQQWMPGIAVQPDGTVLITWQGTGAGNTGNAIVGQVFHLTPDSAGDPVATDDHGYVSRGIAAISTTTLLANDTGPDGVPLTLQDGGDAVNGYYGGLDPNTGTVYFDTSNMTASSARFSYTIAAGTRIDVGQVSLRVVDTTDGNDQLIVHTLANEFSIIDGLAGNDRLVGGAGLDTLIGSDGDDRLSGKSGADILCGGDGNDRLDGGIGADRLEGASGNDTYYVDDARDRVIEAAGGGRDMVVTKVSYTLTTGQQIETLKASGAEGLTLTGNDFGNKIVGGAGNDVLDGGRDNDTLFGRLGDDIYYVDSAKDRVIEEAGGGNDTVYARANYTLTVGQQIETLRVLNSSSSMLTGNEFANTIVGGHGNDTLAGALGRDTMKGGAGHDTFMFKTAADSGYGAADRDVILDFEVGVDHVNVSALQAVAGASANQLFTFIGAAAFTKHAGELHTIQSKGSTIIEGDTDGNGTADFQIVLRSMVDALHGSDFIL